eukprot:1161726-Pelagomonas_calceolata.AAC.13
MLPNLTERSLAAALTKDAGSAIKQCAQTVRLDSVPKKCALHWGLLVKEKKKKRTRRRRRRQVGSYAKHSVLQA